MRIGSKLATAEVKVLKKAPGFTVMDVSGLVRKSKGSTKRYKISDAFREYIWSTIPKLEQKVELDIVENLLERMDSEVLKRELTQAYERRKMNIETRNLEPRINLQKSGEVGEIQAGRWCILDAEEFNKVFPNKCFGSYKTDDVAISKVFSLSCTPEVAYLVEIMKNKQNFAQNKFDFKKLVINNEEEGDFAEALSQLENYQGIHSLLAEEMRQQLQQNRTHSLVYHKFGESFIPDMIINILMRALLKDVKLRLILAHDTARKAFFKSLMSQMLERIDEQYVSLRDVSTWAEVMDHISYSNKSLNISEGVLGEDGQQTQWEGKILLKDYVDENAQETNPMFNYALKGLKGINSNIMLHGNRGSGKSGTLNYLATWAWKNEWIVFKVPSVWDLTQKQSKYIRHEETRLFMQPDLTKEILDDFVKTNRHLLANIPVDATIYGKYGVTGCHIDEPEAVQNVFDEWTQTNFYDSDKFLIEGERQARISMHKHLRKMLASKAPVPGNLLELCKLADDHPEYNLAVMAELIEQLQNQSVKPVLVLVDEFNYFFRRTIYPSFRYDNRRLKGFVPPYHLALPRLLMRMDGHKFKNGFKVVASSNYRLYKHIFNAEKIDHPEGFSWELKGMRLDEFKSAIYHFINTSLMTEEDVNDHRIEQLYHESQGNWGILMEFLHRRWNCYDWTDYGLEKLEKALANRT